MKVFSTHSTWADGAHEFAYWIAALPGVAYVNQGNLRDSHVKSGQRDPTFVPTKSSVQVTYYKGGQIQKLFVFGNKGSSIEGLAKRIRKAYNDSKIRGAASQSSNDAVKIPINVQKQMEEGKGRLVENTGVSDVALLTTRMAAVYEEVLSLKPDGEINQFTTTGLSKVVVKALGNKSSVSAIIKALIDRDLIVKRAPIAGHGRLHEWLVRIRKYKVVDQIEAAVATRATFKERSIKETISSAKTEAPEVSNIIPIHPSVVQPKATPPAQDSIGEEINVMSSSFVNLSKMGFTITISEGQLNLTKKLS